MRARLPAIVGLLVVVALAAAATAAAGGGGFEPVTPRSPNATRIEDSYWLVFGLTAGIFLLVEVSLVLFIIRFRSRGRSREVEGPQIRGHTRLELAWTALPVLILAAIGAFVLYKLPGIKDVPSAGAAGSELRIGVEGRQFYWQFTYPNGVVAIDSMRVPVGRPVRLDVSSPVSDVIHSWWVPALGGKIDAIPGHPNHTWFEAKKPGTWHGQCAEFCGIQHAAMRATVRAIPAQQFDAWLSDQAQTQAAGSSDLGAQTFEGVCAKCHGPQGHGGIGPDIAGSAIITDRKALDGIVRNGRRQMPAVGAGWTDRQMDALFTYLKRNIAKGGAGGGQG